MMTQNCVTHTAISKAAEKYNVTILIDCCTTVSEILHKIALKRRFDAVETRDVAQRDLTCPDKKYPATRQERIMGDPEYCEKKCPICTKARQGNRFARVFAVC